MKRLFILIGFFLLIASPGWGTTYYIAASGGSDSNDGSTGSRWATFTKAMTVLQPADTLIIGDGTYTQSLNVTISGTAGNPITFSAENDGMAIVDGQKIRRTLKIYSQSYITVEGIVFKNGREDQWLKSNLADLYGGSNIIIKRCSMFEANPPPNAGYTSAISVAQTTDSLFEDLIVCCSFGRFNFQGADRNTVRRSYIKGYEHILIFYHSDDNIAENNIFVIDPAENDTPASGQGTYTNTNDKGDRNKYYGNVYLGNSTGTTQYGGAGVFNRGTAGGCPATWRQRTGNRMKDNVIYNPQYFAMQIEDDNDLLVENITAVWDRTNTAYALFEKPAGNCGGNTVSNLATTIKNSSILSASFGLHAENTAKVTITNTYNNLYNVSTPYAGKASAGTGEVALNPAYDTATFGKGAYLMVPSALQGQGEAGADIGAEVLYRYVDGVITATPLWPWPMEERICNETGYSVTYTTPGAPGCTLGGGLFLTLSGIYSDVNPPTLPGDTTIANVVTNTVNVALSWTASTDDTGVTGYNVYEGTGSPCTPAGTPTYTSQLPQYNLSQLSYSTTYCWSVKAYDSSGNLSNAYTTEEVAIGAAPAGGQTYTIYKTTDSIDVTTPGDCSAFVNAAKFTITNGSYIGVFRYLWHATDGLLFCHYLPSNFLNYVDTVHDSGQYQSTGVEMIFDTALNGGASMTAGDYKVVASISGLTTDLKGSAGGMDYTWEPTIPMAVMPIGTPNNNQDTDTGVFIKGRIPWGETDFVLPTAGTQWGCQAAFNSLSQSQLTQVSWNGLSFNVPDDWEVCTFANKTRTVGGVGSGGKVNPGNGGKVRIGK